MRNVNKRFRKANKERAQPADRKRFGLLEKHKVRKEDTRERPERKERDLKRTKRDVVKEAQPSA